MIEIASYTAAGEGSKNEDVYEIHRHPASAEHSICVLADGQGGREGAAAAARTACRNLLRAALDCAPAALMRAQGWQSVMHRADQAVRSDPVAGFTTLLAFCITPTCIRGASSGDSAALLVSDGRAGSGRVGKSAASPTLPELEILTAGQVKNPPVGSGNAHFTGFYADLKSPWTVLAMSDGVWKYTGWDPICRIASRHPAGQDIIDTMRDCAASPVSGRLQDDFTLVVFQDTATEASHASR